MIIKKTFPSVPVDAGVICVADHKWLRRQGAMELGADIELVKGIYDVTLVVHNTWHGRVCVRRRMKLDGLVYVGDPCYGGFSDDAWRVILTRTDYFRKLSSTVAQRLLCVCTGGDGGMRTTVTFSMLKPGKQSFNI